MASPRYPRTAEKRLKKRQRELSRKEKGSRNRDKARIQVARAHAKVADARRNFPHQWSHKLTSENQAVFAETLNVRGLARGRLAKSVHDAGWAQFARFCEYKAIRRGRSFAKVARDFAVSLRRRYHRPPDQGPQRGNAPDKRLRSARTTWQRPGSAHNPHHVGRKQETPWSSAPNEPRTDGESPGFSLWRRGQCHGIGEQSLWQCARAR
ncbi:transposase [Streptomyces sp. NPDC048483]|uniref:RNA-guided endonuclease InsQ/TnpB family protein n=1 Tax=Streptomyces sp. NPDC048483 TaxID=3154927 RepID=UPI00344212C7